MVSSPKDQKQGDSTEKQADPISIYNQPVSYTHLDVYKRQPFTIRALFTSRRALPQGIPASSSRPTRLHSIALSSAAGAPVPIPCLLYTSPFLVKI